jgi:hypothetical protein
MRTSQEFCDGARTARCSLPHSIKVSFMESNRDPYWSVRYLVAFGKYWLIDIYFQALWHRTVTMT